VRDQRLPRLLAAAHTWREQQQSRKQEDREHGSLTVRAGSRTREQTIRSVINEPAPLASGSSNPYKKKKKLKFVLFENFQ
jgi:hypothetical protein